MQTLKQSTNVTVTSCNVTQEYRNSSTEKISEKINGNKDWH